MKYNVVIMPASPALVAELAPQDLAGRTLLDAVRTLVAGADQVELVGSRDERWRTEHTGSFAAWGAPQVTVGAGNYLPELLQRYALGPELSARVTEVRAELAELNPRALTLVAVDGSAGMTPRAPLALLDGAEAADQWCRAVLAGETRPALAGESLREAGILDAGLWEELAGVEKRDAALMAADTTLGVARYVAGWVL